MDDIFFPNLNLIELFSSKNSSKIINIKNNPFAITASLNHVKEEADFVEKNTDSVKKNTDSVKKNTDSVEKKIDSVKESIDFVEKKTNFVKKKTNFVKKNTDFVVLIPNGSKATPTVAVKLIK